MFYSDTPVHTTITNTEELVKNVFYIEELVRAGVFFFCWCFYLMRQGKPPPKHHEAKTPVLGGVFLVSLPKYLFQEIPHSISGRLSVMQALVGVELLINMG